jgi:hypothetical protein
MFFDRSIIDVYTVENPPINNSGLFRNKNRKVRRTQRRCPLSLDHIIASSIKPERVTEPVLYPARTRAPFGGGTKKKTYGGGDTKKKHIFDDKNTL